jgi:hypothetical protein
MFFLFVSRDEGRGVSSLTIILFFLTRAVFLAGVVYNTYVMKVSPHHLLVQSSFFDFTNYIMLFFFMDIVALSFAVTFFSHSLSVPLVMMITLTKVYVVFLFIYMKLSGDPHRDEVDFSKSRFK